MTNRKRLSGLSAAVRARPRRRELPRDHVFDADARHPRNPKDHVRADALRALAHVREGLALESEADRHRLPAAHAGAQEPKGATPVLLLLCGERKADHAGTDTKDGSIPTIERVSGPSATRSSPGMRATRTAPSGAGGRSIGSWPSVCRSQTRSTSAPSRRGACERVRRPVHGDSPRGRRLPNGDPRRTLSEGD